MRSRYFRSHSRNFIHFVESKVRYRAHNSPPVVPVFFFFLAKQIHSTNSRSMSLISILILSSHPRRTVSFLQLPPPKPCIYLSSPPHVWHTPPPSCPFYLITHVASCVKITKLLIRNFSPVSCYFRLLGPNYVIRNPESSNNNNLKR